jgi:hypothetical protein
LLAAIYLQGMFNTDERIDDLVDSLPDGALSIYDFLDTHRDEVAAWSAVLSRTEGWPLALRAAAMIHVAYRLEHDEQPL